MADSIILNVSELRSRIQDLRRDGIKYVELSISDSDEIDGDVLPPSLNFSGCTATDLDTWFDYEELDAVDNESELQERSFNALHMSSNLI